MPKKRLIVSVTLNASMTEYVCTSGCISMILNWLPASSAASSRSSGCSYSCRCIRSCWRSASCSRSVSSSASIPRVVPLGSARSKPSITNDPQETTVSIPDDHANQLDTTQPVGEIAHDDTDVAFAAGSSDVGASGGRLVDDDDDLDEPEPLP